MRGGVFETGYDMERLHQFNAYVGTRLRIPHKLHGDFRAALGGLDADTRLRAWYATVDAEIERTGEPIRPDVWKWAEARFRAWLSQTVVDDEWAKINQLIAEG